MSPHLSSPHTQLSTKSEKYCRQPLVSFCLSVKTLNQPRLTKELNKTNLLVYVPAEPTPHKELKC